MRTHSTAAVEQLTEVSRSVAPKPAWGLQGSLVRALIELTKPAVTRMVTITAICGALAAPSPIQWGKLVLAIIGTVLVVGSANALNMFLEYDVDSKMSRTAARPIPSGRISRGVAYRFGLLLAAIGLPLLTFGVNPVSGLLAAFALVSYVTVYTPMKRVSDYSLHVGAIPGAVPPAIGYAAMEGELGLAGWLLFAILFVWQLPHFGAISIFRRAEYERAGLKVIAVVRGVQGAKRFIVFHSLSLLGVSLLPTVLGLTGWVYFAIAAVSGLGFLALGLSAWGWAGAWPWGRMKAPRGSGARASEEEHAAQENSMGNIEGAPSAQPALSLEERRARALFFATMPHLVVLFVAFVLSV